MTSLKKSTNGLPEIEFPPLTPKQLSNRALLEEEAEKMADAAVRRGWHVSVLSFASGVKYTSKDLEVEDEYPASATTVAAKSRHDKKIEKKEALMEQICTQCRAFGMLVMERLPSNMKSYLTIAFPKHVMCSEEYGAFDLVSFGYAFKSLADLTSETTKEQKADKMRKDVAAIIKEGCKDQGSLPSYFKKLNDVFNYGKHYRLDYPMSTVIYNAAEGIKIGQLRSIYLKYREYCSFRDNRAAIVQNNSTTGYNSDNSQAGGVEIGGGENQSSSNVGENVSSQSSSQNVSQSSSSSTADAVQDAIQQAVEAAKAAALEVVRRSAHDAGINPDNGVPMHLDNLFNPDKFESPNDVCTKWMRVQIDVDEGKDSRVISLTTIDQKVDSSLSHQATVFANIFEKRGMEFTDEEKKALLKKPQKAKKSKNGKKGQSQAQQKPTQQPQPQRSEKSKKTPLCKACGGEHWFQSGDKYVCTDKAAIKKYLLEQAAQFT